MRVSKAPIAELPSKQRSFVKSQREMKIQREVLCELQRNEVLLILRRGEKFGRPKFWPR